MIIVQNLDEYISDAALTAKEVFREIHSWPEAGNQEYKTAALIGKKLKAMGLEIKRPLATAVTADIKGTGSHLKTIAFRAELDALSVAEETMVSYRSRRAGMMHACGHDAHSAMLIGLAQILCRLQGVLPCNVRLIFQPDEEGSGGAEKLVDKGVLKDVDYIFGFHVKPELPAGTVGIKYGTVHGASKVFYAEVSGTASHGAKPDLGRDAIYAAAEYISMCQGIVSRNLAPEQSGLISFGTIRGGQERNVLSDRTVMEGILRGENAAICSLLEERMKILAKGLSRALGVHIKIDFDEGCKAVVNDPLLTRKISEAAQEKTAELKEISMTVDDFSAYLQKIPGAYFFLGSGFPDRENSGLHTGTFQINEACLKTGIQTLIRLCLSCGE